MEPSLHNETSSRGFPRVIDPHILGRDGSKVSILCDHFLGQMAFLRLVLVLAAGLVSSSDIENDLLNLVL